MWLENLKDLKKRTGMSTKQIAEKTKLPERTVARILSGETDNPYIDTLHRIVTVLGGSLDDILADTKVVVGDATLVTLQAELEALKISRDALITENAAQKEKIEALRNKVEDLKDEIIALHKYYMKLNNKD